MTHNFGGKHTDTKLDILRKYLGAYSTALKNMGFGLIYIDAFAGTGERSTILEATDGFFTEHKKIITTPGSAKIALETEPGFQLNIFIEQNANRFKKLKKLTKQYPNKKIRLCHGDANDYVTGFCQKFEWQKPSGGMIGKRGVIFLDPYGMEVEWRTIESIAATKALDAWIFFPLMGLYRNAATNKEKIIEQHRNAITKILGTDAWLNDWYQKNNQQSFEFDISDDEQRINVDSIEKYVRKRLQTVFKGAVLKPMRIYNQQDKPLASLFFCISNESPKAIGLATKFANHILKAG